MPGLDDHLIFLTSAVARIEARLTNIEKAIAGNGMPGLVQKVEALEQHQSKITGGVTVIGVLGASLWGFLEYLFHFYGKSGGGSGH